MSCRRTDIRTEAITKDRINATSESTWLILSPTQEELERLVSVVIFSEAVHGMYIESFDMVGPDLKLGMREAKRSERTNDETEV